MSQVSEIVDFYRHDRTPYKSELMFAREGGVVDTMFSFNSPELNQALDTFFTITYTTDLDQPQNRPQSAFTYVKEAKVPAIRGEIVSHNLYFNVRKFYFFIFILNKKNFLVLNSVILYRILWVKFPTLNTMICQWDC